MLVRLPNDTLRDLPDEVAALILADPSQNDEISDCTSYEVNLIIHGVLGAHYSFAQNQKTFDEIVDELREHFLALAPPESRMATAYLLLKKYHIEVSDDEIGMVDPRDMFQFANDIPTKGSS